MASWVESSSARRSKRSPIVISRRSVPSVSACQCDRPSAVIPIPFLLCFWEYPVHDRLTRESLPDCQRKGIVEITYSLTYCCEEESVSSLVNPPPPGEGGTVSVTATKHMKAFMRHTLKGTISRLNAVSVIQC